eukprot:CAMPEP_0119071522 /NCGR_PEP_ID=MMETSP1178-20130426/51246_1 /TAXON_ID=33656 /ORGANISM="unid sp, Strain CCMP2000" /LENGTH=32 /DNA_ID= /DNA_START= /DNA_END= /DNA_ORIENTATION=
MAIQAVRYTRRYGEGSGRSHALVLGHGLSSSG